VVGRAALAVRLVVMLLLVVLVVVQGLTVVMRGAVRFLCLRYKARMGATILALLLSPTEPVAVVGVLVL
jgi:hypothetical protein